MYPYNRKTSLYSETINTAEMPAVPKNEENSETLSNERSQLIEAMEVAMNKSAELSRRYSAMMEKELFAPSSHVIRSMYLDELRHTELLKATYEEMGGDPASVLIAESELPDTEAIPLLEDTLLLAMDESDFYRTLDLSAPNDSLKEAFYEIMTDKMNHSTAMCYLFSKYSDR